MHRNVPWVRIIYKNNQIFLQEERELTFLKNTMPLGECSKIDNATAPSHAISTFQGQHKSTRLYKMALPVIL